MSILVNLCPPHAKGKGGCAAKAARVPILLPNIKQKKGGGGGEEAVPPCSSLVLSYGALTVMGFSFVSRVGLMRSISTNEGTRVKDGMLTSRHFLPSAPSISSVENSG